MAKNNEDAFAVTDFDSAFNTFNTQGGREHSASNAAVIRGSRMIQKRPEPLTSAKNYRTQSHNISQLIQK